MGKKTDKQRQHDAELRQHYLRGGRYSDNLPVEIAGIMNERQLFCLDVNYAYLVQDPRL